MPPLPDCARGTRSGQWGAGRAGGGGRGGGDVRGRAPEKKRLLTAVETAPSAARRARARRAAQGRKLSARPKRKGHGAVCRHGLGHRGGARGEARTILRLKKRCAQEVPAIQKFKSFSELEARRLAGAADPLSYRCTPTRQCRYWRWRWGRGAAPGRPAAKFPRLPQARAASKCKLPQFHRYNPLAPRPS